MSNFTKNIIDALVNFSLSFREAASGFLGPALPTLYWIAGITSGVLLWIIIYLGIRSSFFVKRAEDWVDKMGIGSIGKWRQLRAWKHIIKRMKTKDSIQWKLAIVEADAVLDEILKEAGYRKDTTDERFKQLTPAVLSNTDMLMEAHRVRNRVSQEPDFEISFKEALDVLKVYKKSFQEFGLLD